MLTTFTIHDNSRGSYWFPPAVCGIARGRAARIADIRHLPARQGRAAPVPAASDRQSLSAFDLPPSEFPLARRKSAFANEPLQPGKVVIAIEGTWHYAIGIIPRFTVLRSADRLRRELGADPCPQQQLAVTFSFRIDLRSCRTLTGHFRGSGQGAYASSLHELSSGERPPLAGQRQASARAAGDTGDHLHDVSHRAQLHPHGARNVSQHSRTSALDGGADRDGLGGKVDR